MHPLDLYERCVLAPDQLAALLRSIHGHAPRILGEDFAGTGALSLAWAAASGAHAVAVDRDAAALGHHPPHPRVSRHAADVCAVDAPCDVLYVGNFSIGYHHSRAALLDYLRHARRRLRAGGVFCCDLYGGPGALEVQVADQDIPLPEGWVRYTWEQRSVEPLSGRVCNAIHFSVFSADATLIFEHEDAFVYDWRLWGLAELSEAMVEAGFSVPRVYPKEPDAVGEGGEVLVEPLRPGELEEDYVVLLVAGVE